MIDKGYLVMYSGVYWQVIFSNYQFMLDNYFPQLKFKTNEIKHKQINKQTKCCIVIALDLIPFK